MITQQVVNKNYSIRITQWFAANGGQQFVITFSTDSDDNKINEYLL